MILELKRVYLKVREVLAMNIDRRDFLRLLGFGSAVFVFGNKSILNAADEI